MYEETENPTKYYSLYPTTDEKGKYQFYISPEDKKSKLYEVNFNSSSCDADIIIYPNTIDFEFMNVNSRRNDIYYSDGKRVIEGKINRPIHGKNGSYLITLPNTLMIKIKIKLLNFIKS